MSDKKAVLIIGPELSASAMNHVLTVDNRKDGPTRPVNQKGGSVTETLGELNKELGR